MVPAGRPGVASTPGGVEASTDTLALPDGVVVSLRPIGPGDRGAVGQLFARLTPESRFRRFLSPKPGLTARDLSYFTDVDHVDHVAIVAVDERSGTIVGTGSCPV
jgi:hypothetical protein